MIEADVLVEFKSWNKIIQSPQRQISNILKKFPKRYKFIYKKVHLTVLLTNTNEIKILNKKFRNKDKHTDVLSFPFSQKKKRSKELYLGDIIISFNYMNKPRNLTNKAFKEKTIRIFIHGFLHLLGYDHIKNTDYKKMFINEQNIFNSLKKILN